MRYLLLLLLLIPAVCFAEVKQSTSTSDGTTTVWNPWQVTYTNASVVDDGDGSATVNINGSSGSSVLTVQNQSIEVGNQSTLNFIAGSGITLAGVNDTGNSKINLTITAAAGGGNISGTGAAYQVGYYTTANTIDGDANFNFCATTEVLSIPNLTITTTLTATDLIDSAHYAADSIDDEHINWGSGAGQVDTDDVTEGSSNLYEGTTVSNSASVNLTLSTLDISGAINGTWAGQASIVTVGNITTGTWSGDFDPDIVKDTDIDWGSGAGQVEVTDIEAGVVNIILETEMDASSELASIIDDEVGTGNIVFNTSTFLDSPTIQTAITLPANVLDGNDIAENTLSIKNITKSWSVYNITTSHDFPVFKAEKAMTLIRVAAICDQGTNATVLLEECNSTYEACTGMDTAWIVANGTPLNDTSFSNAGIDAGDYVKFNVTAVNGNPPVFHVTTVWDE